MVSSLERKVKVPNYILIKSLELKRCDSINKGFVIINKRSSKSERRRTDIISPMSETVGCEEEDTYKLDTSPHLFNYNEILISNQTLSKSRRADSTPPSRVLVSTKFSSPRPPKYECSSSIVIFKF